MVDGIEVDLFVDASGRRMNPFKSRNLQRGGRRSTSGRIR